MGRSPLLVLSVVLLRRLVPSAAAAPSLHELADKFGTDKSLAFGHAYVSAYGMLLDPLRHSARNVTEVGVLTGSSILMWASYFPRAEIWGLDIAIQSVARRRCMNETRIKLRQASSQNEHTPDALGLRNETME